MRLIDADAFAVFSYKGTEGYADCFDGGVLFTLERLDKAPTVDAVEVVRCKNCIHRHESEFRECRPEDFYCADGERKEATE